MSEEMHDIDPDFEHLCTGCNEMIAECNCVVTDEELEGV